MIQKYDVGDVPLVILMSALPLPETAIHKLESLKRI